VVREPCGAVAPPAEGAPSEPQSFEAFFLEQHARLFGTLCLVTGHAAEAEELMQESFVRVLERWDRVSVHADPTGYLYRTAFNVFRDRTRRLRAAPRRLLLGIASPADAYARVDEQQTVLEALRHLTPRQRAAVVLTEMLEFSSEEAAKVLGVRPVTVRVLASQGRAALRKTLGEPDD
jgi:RNA polymerase sigma-70 factor, ECF subfamily